MVESREWTGLSDEGTMDWEVVDSSTSGHTEYDGDSDIDACEVATPVTADKTWEETAEQDPSEHTKSSPAAVENDICRIIQTAKTSEETNQKSAKRIKGDDLKPCKNCNGYHYTSQCIYTLTWTEWLDYHLTYMPSQSYGHSPEGLGEDTSDMQMLYYRAEELDDVADSSQINYLSDTRLKADLMTMSSVQMYLDDEKWQKRLREDDDSGRSGAAGSQAVTVSRDENFDLENAGDALDTMNSDLRHNLPC